MSLILTSIDVYHILENSGVGIILLVFSLIGVLFILCFPRTLFIFIIFFFFC